MRSRPTPVGPLNQPTLGGLVAGAFGLAIAGIAIWALVSAAGITLNALSLTFVALFGSSNDQLLGNLVLSGIAGAFGGVAIVTFRAFTRKPNHFTESFLSALFSKGLANPVLDAAFWGRTLLGGSVGFAVGAVNGASGILNFLHPLSDKTSAVFQNGTFPIVVFLAGGFGGPGGNDLWSLLFLALVVILAAVIVGFLAGLVLHALAYGIAGMTKGGTKAYVIQILQPPPRNREDAGKKHPITTGMINGLITGLIVGTIEAAFTVWGAAHFFNARSH